MDKPRYLYHGSVNKELKELRPGNITPRYEEEGDSVFATPHIALAAMFLCPRTIPVEIGIYGDRFVLFAESDEKTFRDLDKGGAIYTLPAESFTNNYQIGMHENEWVSAESIKPIKRDVYITAVDVMQAHGVEIYLVNQNIMRQIRSNPSSGLDIIKSSRPFH